MSESSIDVTAFIPPPPTPAMALEAMSCHMSWESPQPSEPRPKKK